MNAWRDFPEHKSFLVAVAARQLSPGDPYMANSPILSQSRARREPSEGSAFLGIVLFDNSFGSPRNPTRRPDEAQIRMTCSRSSAWSAKLDDARCLKK
jgi:hypothetical protein